MAKDLALSPWWFGNISQRLPGPATHASLKPVNSLEIRVPLQTSMYLEENAYLRVRKVRTLHVVVRNLQIRG